MPGQHDAFSASSTSPNTNQELIKSFLTVKDFFEPNFGYPEF